MKIRVLGFITFIVILIAIGGAVLLRLRDSAPSPTVNTILEATSAAETVAGGQMALRLSADPFPMTVGPTMLRVSLTDADGQTVDGADVTVTREVVNQGGATLNAITLVQGADGAYSGRFVWPTAAQWLVGVSAKLPDGEILTDQYELYIYAIPPAKISGEPFYHAVSETAAAAAADSAREMWIVIPQGTQEMIKHGQAADVVPAEIRLQTDGRNTLVIRNNDIADHTIGPYFVRAGETVRQRFNTPATFVGTCSIRQRAEVSIIVEG